MQILIYWIYGVVGLIVSFLVLYFLAQAFDKWAWGEIDKQELREKPDLWKAMIEADRRKNGNK